MSGASTAAPSRREQQLRRRLRVAAWVCASVLGSIAILFSGAVASYGLQPTVYGLLGQGTVYLALPDDQPGVAASLARALADLSRADRKGLSVGVHGVPAHVWSGDHEVLAEHLERHLHAAAHAVCPPPAAAAPLFASTLLRADDCARLANAAGAVAAARPLTRAGLSTVEHDAPAAHATLVARLRALLLTLWGNAWATCAVLYGIAPLAALYFLFAGLGSQPAGLAAAHPPLRAARARGK